VRFSVVIDWQLNHAGCGLTIPAPQGLGTGGSGDRYPRGRDHGDAFMSPNSPKGQSGVSSEQASDLRDNRQGTYDPIGNQKKPDLSEPTSRERAQPGGAMQGEPVPAEISSCQKI